MIQMCKRSLMSASTSPSTCEEKRSSTRLTHPSSGRLMAPLNSNVRHLDEQSPNTVDFGLCHFCTCKSRGRPGSDSASQRRLRAGPQRELRNSLRDPREGTSTFRSVRNNYEARCLGNRDRSGWDESLVIHPVNARRIPSGRPASLERKRQRQSLRRNDGALRGGQGVLRQADEGI